MNNFQLKTPVVFIIFNRPETTKKVFEKIRQAKPEKLLIIADGPRKNHPEDKEKCAATRKVINGVDWKCKVLKNYSNTNLGLAKRISSGLDWVFDNVNEAIILEDDCLPNLTFFQFCKELLKKYQNDERIFAITGQNVQFGKKRTNYSYYFSRYFHCWGWATWKRAWNHFDFDMKQWPKMKNDNYLKKILKNNRAVKYWTKIFQSCYEGKINSWAYKWIFAGFISRSLNIIPNVNLISNIGFGTESTHLKDSKNPYANMPTEKIIFPLKHPPGMMTNKKADNFEQKTLFDPTLFARIKWKLKRILK
jgi:hypothetical protein